MAAQTLVEKYHVKVTSFVAVIATIAIPLAGWVGSSIYGDLRSHEQRLIRMEVIYQTQTHEIDRVNVQLETLRSDLKLANKEVADRIDRLASTIERHNNAGK